MLDQKETCSIPQMHERSMPTRIMGSMMFFDVRESFYNSLKLTTNFVIFCGFGHTTSNISFTSIFTKFPKFGLLVINITDKLELQKFARLDYLVETTNL